MSGSGVGLGKLHGVDQRGVVELVGEDRIATPSQGRRHGEVGEITGGKGQGAGKAGEGRDFLFQRFVRREMAADQVRGTGAGTPLQRTVSQRTGDLGIAGQPEIIVGGEIQHIFAVHRGKPATGTFQHAAPAGQAGGGELLQLGGEFCAQAIFNQMGRHRALFSRSRTGKSRFELNLRQGLVTATSHRCERATAPAPETIGF